MGAEPAVVRFEQFELDVRSRELKRGATRIRLQEQPFEVLRLMLERPGDVVTREELARRLWPEGTFVDFEHSLNAAIKRLRTALGDDADNPRFVETLPRRGYRFIAALNGRSGVAAAPEPVRLAVLPFTNQSGDAAQEWFSDGLTDEMIAQLGRAGRSRVAVIARWSSMVFKGSTRRAREIGEALKADYLLEGSVRREGDRVRISAWLVDAARETHLWSDTYERHLTDCLAVQADVAARIAQSLALELVGDEGDAPPVASTSTAAYQAYLKGRYYWNQAAAAAIPPSIRYFEEAVAADPSFGQAWSSLGRAWIGMADTYLSPPCEACDAAQRAAERALKLDPGLSDAHLSLGDVRRIRQQDWAGAEAAYTQAIALNPSSEAAHRMYALLLAGLGRVHEAGREAERALALDPLCLVVGTSAAWVHYLHGDYHTAIEQCALVIEMDRSFVRARRVLGAALQQSGHPIEAAVELQRALDIEPGDLVTRAWLAHARAAAGEVESASALLAELLAMRRSHDVPAYHLALAHLAAGTQEAAIDALGQAIDECDPSLIFMATEPRFAPLYPAPGFTRVLERLKLAG